MTPKVVMFSMDVGEQPKNGVTRDAEGCSCSCAMLFCLNFVCHSICHTTLLHCIIVVLSMSLSIERSACVIELSLVPSVGPHM